MTRFGCRGADEGRRNFLRRSALAGMAAVAQCFLPPSRAEAFIFGWGEEKVAQTRLVMGTYVSITVIHPSEEQAHEAIALAFAEIDRLDALLSRHRDDTPLSLLNRQGRLTEAPDELLTVVQHSLAYHRSSNGAFDITVLPLLMLYKARFAAGATPDMAAIEQRLPLVGSENIKVGGRSIALQKSGMGLTTDGIAKGYVVDRAARVLADNGVENFLINAGGDIRIKGSALKGRPWTIAIQDPAKNRDYPQILRLQDGAVATSGNYEIFFDEKKVFHHIVDPQTGRSPQGIESVTTLAPTVMAADALATAVFVQGPRIGSAYVDSQPQAACLVIGSGGTLHRSRRWPK